MERPEGIDTGHTIMCNDPRTLEVIFISVINNYVINAECPYGDGNSSKRIIDVIRSGI